MRNSLLPKFFFVVLLALVAGAFLPGASDLATAKEEAEEDDGEPTDFWDGDTTFSDKQVEIAIRKGVTWLKKKQQRNGSWGSVKGNAAYGGGEVGQNPGSHHSGPTALALFTLLKCKEKENDPVIRKGFDFIKSKFKKPAGSYETSMLLLALTATADQFKTSKGSKAAEKLDRIKLKGKYRSWATKLVDHLVDKKEAMGWRYNWPGQAPGPGGPQDVSSTQLAALALFAAHRAGIKVKKKVWEDILKYSMSQQDDDGPEIEYPDPLYPNDKTKIRKANARGFAYIKGQEEPDEGEATGAMTACALANIEMARYVISDGRRDGGRKRWLARDDAEAVQTSIYDGIAWLEKNWSPFDNPKKKRMNVYHIYWMYAVERAMDLFDLRLVGSHNWYNEMGQELLNRQRKEGFWKTGSTHEPEDVIDTCFALLFLKRSTAGSIPFGSITGGGGDPIDSR